jgi:GxxExxY protein
VYQKSLAYELRRLGLLVEDRPEILVYYEGQQVGEYEGDLLIGGVVLLELKGARELCPEHEAQLLNYLKATRIEVGLLLNFGIQPTIKRKVFDNERKGHCLDHAGSAAIRKSTQIEQIGTDRCKCNIRIST